MHDVAAANGRDGRVRGTPPAHTGEGAREGSARRRRRAREVRFVVGSFYGRRDKEVDPRRGRDIPAEVRRFRRGTNDMFRATRRARQRDETQQSERPHPRAPRPLTAHRDLRHRNPFCCELRSTTRQSSKRRLIFSPSVGMRSSDCTMARAAPFDSFRFVSFRLTYESTHRYPSSASAGSTTTSPFSPLTWRWSRGALRLVRLRV